MNDDEIPAAPGLRVGNAERERAAEALGEHLRAGRLDTSEYDDRVTTAWAARTAEDIHPLFIDLPGGSPLASSIPADATAGPSAPYGTEAHWGPRERGAAWSAAGGRWGPPGSGSRRRRAGWLVPAALVFVPFFIASLAFGGDHEHGHDHGHPPFFLLPLLLVFLFFMVNRVRGGGFGRGFARGGLGRAREMADRWTTGGPGRNR